MALGALPLQARNVQVSHREKWQIRTYINGNLMITAIFRRHGNGHARCVGGILARVLVRGSSSGCATAPNALCCGTRRPAVVSNGGALCAGAHRICRNSAPGADGEPVRDRWVRKMTTALRSAVDMRKGSKICEHGLLASFHPPGLFVAAAQRPTLCVQLPFVQAGQEAIKPQRPQSPTSHRCLQSAR